MHDAVLDYYGRRLATCSSDKTIKMFEIEGESQKLIETLKGHEGAVWSVAWAHPKHGNMLASGGYDGKVLVWCEQNTQWQRLFEFALHKSSVNSVAWAPHESGCLLACASADGAVSVLELKGNSFDHITFTAHGEGVNAVSWAPATNLASIVSSSSTSSSTANSSSNNNNSAAGAAGSSPARRFATAGCDNTVKIWAFDAPSNSYKLESELTGHSDWVRDVVWSPTVLQKSYLASASQDKSVKIWTSEPVAPGKTVSWSHKTINFDAVVWRVSWSLSGNVLAVSSGDNKITLWKENLRGEWECVKTIDE